MRGWKAGIVAPPHFNVCSFDMTCAKTGIKLWMRVAVYREPFLERRYFGRMVRKV